MSKSRIVVYDTVRVKIVEEPDYWFWICLVGVGIFLYLQYLVGLEFDAVYAAPFANVPYTVLIGTLFVLMYLVEIVPILLIAVGILVLIARAVRSVVNVVHRVYKRVF